MPSEIRSSMLLRSMVATLAASSCLLWGSVAFAASPTPTVSYGAQGTAVDQLQSDLINLGYHQIPGVNGYFGNGTQAALASFENAVGLATGATVTPAVWQALRSTLGACQIGTVPLMPWDTGFAVRVLQGDLWQFGENPGSVNGVFDAQTESALMDFQGSVGLPVSGRMDQATFGAILSALGLPSSDAPTPGCHPGTATPPTSSSNTIATQPFLDGTTVQGEVTASTQRIAGLPVVKIMRLVATAYAPTLQDNYPYGPVDFFGAPLQLGMVAVDPRVIPLHTKMYITGYQSPYLPQGGMLVTALDTGGAIQGDRMDVFIPQSEANVNAFGIQTITAYILG